MKGTKYNHTGIYLGNGKVFEMTSCSAWGVKKAVISDIDSKGIRSRNGVKCLKWTYHGRLNYIDYRNEPEPTGQVALLQSKMNEQWNCGLKVDNHFGPLTAKACRNHQLKLCVKAPIMVKWLQHRLNELGYSLEEDGSFGYKTQKAVRSFQKSKGLKPDSIVGQYTYKALTK